MCKIFIFKLFRASLERSPLSRVTAVVLGSLATLQPGAFLHAAAPIWSGTTNGNWSLGGVGGNWTNAAAPVAGDSLTFTGTSNVSTINDLAADTSFTGITFDNLTTGGAFTLAGNRITLGGNITSTGTTGTPTHTISLDMIMDGNRTLTAIGSNDIIVSGIISQSGGARNLTKSGAGNLTLSGANSFTGQFISTGGTTLINTIADSGTNSALGAGSSFRLGNAAGNASLTYTGGAQNTNRQLQIGNGAAATHDGGSTITNNGSGALVFTNANFNILNSIAITGRTLNLGGTDVNLNEIQGIIADNSASGTIALTKSNAGRWVLSGNNSYSGLTTVDDGYLRIQHPSALGTATNGTNVTSGATLELANNITVSGEVLTLTGTGEGNNGALRNVTGNNTWASQITLTGNSSIQSDGGLLTLDVAAGNAISGAFNLTLGTGLGDITIADAISTGTGALTKTGVGTLTLSGLNTFSGAVGLNSGVTVVNTLNNTGTDSSLGNGSTTSVIRLGSSSNTATLRYAGSGATSDRQIQIGSSTVTDTGGGIIESEGTSGPLTFSNTAFNATTGAITATRTLTLGGSNIAANTISGVISNGSSSTGVINLTKNGVGTWELGGVTHTYSGSTVVNAGTLNLLSGGSLASAALTIGSAGVSSGTLNVRAGASLNAATAPLIRQGTLNLENATQTLAAVTLGNAAANATASLTLAGGTAVNQTGNLTYVANTGGHQATISGGAFDLGAGGDPVTRTWTVNDTPGLAVDLTVSSALSFSTTGTKIWTIAGDGRVEVTGVNNLPAAMTTRLQSNGTLRVAAGSSISVGTADIRYGTLEMNNSQSLGQINLGQATAANGNSALVIGSGQTVTMTSNLTYAADDDTANVGFISGGTLDMGSVNRTFLVGDNALVGVSSPELTISSVIAGSSILVKTGTGNLQLSASSTFTGNTQVREGTLILDGNAPANANGTLGNSNATVIVGLNTGSTVGTLLLNSGYTVGRNISVQGNGAAVGVSAIGSRSTSGTAIFNGNISLTDDVELGAEAGVRVEFNGAISGTVGNVEKVGLGNVILGSSGNSYTGTTTVRNGSFQVGNSGVGQTGSGDVIMNNSATLLGTGVIRGATTLNSGASLRPGDSVADSSHGTLTFTPVNSAGTHNLQGNVILGISGATTTDATYGGNVIGSSGYNAWVDGISGGGSHDRLVFNNPGTYSLNFLTATGSLQVVGSSFVPVAGQVFNLLDWSTLTTDFVGFSFNSGLLTGNGDEGGDLDLPDISGSGLLWDFSRFTTSGNIVVVVPEPSRFLLLMMGCAGLLLRRRRTAISSIH